jgi:hypothetical protein
MATAAPHAPRFARDDDKFFLISAVVMTLVLVGGFSMQLASGRSSFDAPPLVHAHAVVFMGWVGIYLSQSVLATSGGLRLHRRLGWIAAVWIVPMLIFGCAVVISMMRSGTVPFFFTPLQFFALDVFSLLAFAGLMVAGIVNRRRTDWHRRLNFCAMTLLLGPGVGRLLPMPFLIPYAFEATVAVIILFPIAGMIADVSRAGRIHPAWHWGFGIILGHLLVTELFTHTKVGVPLYDAIVAGAPGAAISPLDHGVPPVGPLITGRPASI